MGSLEQQKCGGYNAQFLQELSDEHECPVCKMALCEPVLTLCGHTLCFSCSEEMKRRNNGVLFCPLDKTILNSGEIFPDKFTERIILQLKTKCDNFLKSCQWTGELKAINNHLTSCEYPEVKCLNEQCSTALLRKELSDHMEKHCIYRLVTCQYCKLKINFCDNQSHEEKCECLPLCCINQCGMKVLRKEMSAHITDSCANTIVPCQYLKIGCKFKGMRKEHATHANSSMQNHLSMAISKLDALENKMTLTVDTLENKIASKLNALENKITSKMESLETKIASESIALENKITSKVESFENKNASEAVALENKITSTVDALKNELISKVDEQKDKIELHEKNLEIIKAVLAVEMDTLARRYAEIVPLHDFLRSTIYFQTQTDFKKLRSFTISLYEKFYRKKINENKGAFPIETFWFWNIEKRIQEIKESDYALLAPFQAWCDKAKKNYK